MDQPGTQWRYNTGAQVLGIVLERASGQPLEEFLRARLFEPLGMTDTSFSVPPEKQDRFTTAYIPNPETGALDVLDEPRTGSWSTPQAMGNVAGMLVSTLDDYWAFVSMLLADGSHDGQALLSRGAVRDMTRNHLSAAQRAAGAPILEAGEGWGYCMAAPPDGDARPPVPSGFGWNGGLGTAWRSDTARGVTGILFTLRAMNSPEPPPHFVDFWAGAYGALAD
jgi:CubicO group peptidase (beta-lactamase class C family)